MLSLRIIKGPSLGLLRSTPLNSFSSSSRIDSKSVTGDDAIFDSKDRSRIIPVEISIKYMVSPAYNETYGECKVWELYRRNYPKGLKNIDTRKTCIKHGRLITNNPCPICRDEYLVVDYRNTRLLKQFIKEYNGEVLTSRETGVCRNRFFDLRIAIEKAKLYGLLDCIDPFFVEYDYNQYRPKKDAS